MRYWPPSIPSRQGVTLIELLVVVSILLILTAIALPRIQPAMESREIREAARAINVYLGAARNRAIEIRRPVGVLIQRFETQRNAGTVLQQVEIPLPYSGDTIDTRVKVYWNNASTPKRYEARIYGSISSAMIRTGDILQIGYQGTRYTIDSIDSQTLVISPRTTGATLPWPSIDPSDTPELLKLPLLPFTVIRQPLVGTSLVARRSATAALTLPRNVVIDLEASGMGMATLADCFAYDGTNTDPVVIIFSPTGAVNGIVYSGTTRTALDPVYLLVGSWDRMNKPEDGLANWQDLTNLWVALTPQTGMVTVSNVYADPTSIDAATNTMRPTTISESRTTAQQAQVNHGGR